MQRVALINWKNKNQDYDLAKIFQSLWTAGVGEWLQVTNWSVSAWYWFVNITRDSKTFPVLFASDSAVTIDTTWTKKVFIEINQSNIDDGSINNPDWTWIWSIKTASSYPSSNYIPLASISSWTITDARVFIQGYLTKRNQNETITWSWNFAWELTANKLLYNWGIMQIIYVGTSSTWDWSWKDWSNLTTLSEALTRTKTTAKVMLYLYNWTYHITSDLICDIPYVWIEWAWWVNSCEIIFDCHLDSSLNKWYWITFRWWWFWFYNLKLTQASKVNSWLGTEYWTEASIRVADSVWGIDKFWERWIIRDCITNIVAPKFILSYGGNFSFILYGWTINTWSGVQYILACGIEPCSLHYEFVTLNRSSETTKLCTSKVWQSLLTNITDTNLVDYVQNPTAVSSAKSFNWTLTRWNYTVSIAHWLGRTPTLVEWFIYNPQIGDKLHPCNYTPTWWNRWMNANHYYSGEPWYGVTNKLFRLFVEQFYAENNYTIEYYISSVDSTNVTITATHSGAGGWLDWINYNLIIL